MKEQQILQITRKAAILKEKKAQREQTTASEPEALNSLPSPPLAISPKPFAANTPPSKTKSPGLDDREWWSQRWVDVLESFGWRRRLERARNYVREGRVLSLEFKKNKVIATVQGTAPDPYDVSLFLDPFSDEQWQFVIETMAAQALFAAKLLAGEMPHTIEEAFIANGLSLFPFNKFDIHSHCSCPDPVNPCKHIGAVYYLLGDYFGRDPFILFQLRGRTKSALTQQLRQLRTDAMPPNGDTRIQQEATRESNPSPLYAPPNLNHYWDYSTALDPSLVVIAPHSTQENLLNLLGPLPLAPGTTHPNDLQAVLTHLHELYQAMSDYGLTLAMSQPDPS